MLMDMFHDLAPVEKKMRVHFHSFMSDVHTRIHQVKQDTVRDYESGTKPKVYDPIPPVAEDIAEEAWLLCFDEFQVFFRKKLLSLYRLVHYSNKCVYNCKYLQKCFMFRLPT